MVLDQPNSKVTLNYGLVFNQSRTYDIKDIKVTVQTDNKDWWLVKADQHTYLLHDTVSEDPTRGMYYCQSIPLARAVLEGNVDEVNKYQKVDRGY